MNKNSNSFLESNILSGEALQKRLEEVILHAEQHITFISAYITENPIKWLYSLVPNNVDIKLVCRLSPSDAIQGSTSIEGLKFALQNNMSVFRLHNLHAKIYSIDDKEIFSGSANFTNNGLLLYGRGNLEATTQIAPSKANIDYINNILEWSTPVNESALDKMRYFVSSKDKNNVFNTWPEDIIKDNEWMLSCDFFWSEPKGNEASHDLELLGLNSFDIDNKIIQERVMQARCVRWLVSKLQAQENEELYFGNLSSLLHDDLKDDPAPYRKDVKGLLSNLLAYVEAYLSNYIEISVPGAHSQRVKIINSIPAKY